MKRGIIMNSNYRYLPHDVNTRYYAVRLYRSGCSIKFVCRRYKVSAASLMRWNARFDGTKTSLEDKSHRPHKVHPNTHTKKEIKWIKDYMRRNPNMTGYELYGKLLQDKHYTRNIASLYRVLKRLGYMKNKSAKKKNAYKPKPYETPEQIGIKWQIDVKEIPKSCYAGLTPYAGDFFQYTVIDEATRERFMHPYLKKDSETSVDFIKRAIRYFRYKPLIIQTDNGAEFVNIQPTDKIHKVDEMLNELEIVHKTIRPRTPRHNGKVERSHGKDQQKFYATLKFYTFDGLKQQLKKRMRKSNNTPTKVLGWKTPKEKRKELMQEKQ